MSFFARDDHQVYMIRHQAIGEQPDGQLNFYFHQIGQVETVIFFLHEYRLTIMAALHDVHGDASNK